jgi:glycosyltransferase involved in cell wall biosynthesis
MRILYDGQIYALQAAGGINRYFASLIDRLPADFTPLLTMYHARELNYPSHPNLKVYGSRRFRPERVAFRLARNYFRRVADGGNFDLAHPTYYTLLTRREVSEYRCPVVITVHDMIHELFPAQMDPTGAHAEEKRRAIEAADSVICVSESTRRDLLERHRLDGKAVSVIHQASEIDEARTHGPEPVPERPYFLFVGARGGYKNFDLLLAAFARARGALAEASLCAVGPPFSRDEERRIAALGLDGRVENYGRVSDAHLARLYRHSVALVYPSLYEGFGIPPLEAMTCGTAVVASNRSSIPEVVGDAGLLFDPESADELTDILLTLARDPSRRESLVERGRERAALFSWDTTAARTVEVYRSLVR